MPSVTVRIPTPLRVLTKNQERVTVEAGTIGELVEKLEKEYPGIKGRICEDDNTIRKFVNIYVDDEDIRFLEGTKTTLKDGYKVSIVPAMAGGIGYNMYNGGQ